MVGPFPVIKLGTLALKQLGKPIANFLKRRAKSNQFFRTYVCLPPAQCLGKPKEVTKLSEDNAAELGADMLGELSMFILGVCCLLFEYRRQANKENNKEEYIYSTLDDLTNQMDELLTFNQIQEAKISELTRILSTLQDHKYIVHN